MMDIAQQPEVEMVFANGLEFAVWCWPGPDPPLVFSHAIGFHGLCWDQVVRHLPPRRVLAVDARGHGRSAKPPLPYRWRDLGADLAAVAERLGVRDAIGIGHSMGGHTVALASYLRPQTFRSLLLIDPAILVPESYGKQPPDASFTLRRRAVYQSPREMYERFHKRPPFVHWKPAVLRDYCEAGLLPRDGEYVLACPPEVEAFLYESSNGKEADIHAEVPRITQPTVIMRCGVPRVAGKFDLGASPADPCLAKRFPNARDVLLKGRSHYIPMEWPERVAEEIVKLLG